MEVIIMKGNSTRVSSILVSAILILIPGVIQAVEEFKISEYGGGIQIWFEAEAFDERNPEGSRYFQVTGEPGVAAKAPNGAFGEAVTRAGGAGGMVRWDFDIGYTEGNEGTWYFWGRVYNPGNLSDYMLVLDDPDDKIPNGPPFPGGDAVPPFDNEDDRIFEATMEIWDWWGNAEGSDKELQDGENTMYIFHRQGSSTVFWDVFMWTDDPMYRPSDEDYTNAKPMKKERIAVQPLEKLSRTWGSIKGIVGE
jgi:hypothetical protein